ncbi:MAG TPA: YbaK/EbsC family protein [Candidatus Saccharimonadales bacterium]|nr:YbaK/EbsC family protein [Candidatus Saccharimonadales bacterium]
MQLGRLDFEAVHGRLDLVAEPVKAVLSEQALTDVYVAAIDPGLADTAAFCEHYAIGMDISANCVIVEAKRADKVWYAACIILATTRADVNNVVRKQLDARKVSFAPMDKAVSMTGMEYGGITPIGLPADWPILVDTKVLEAGNVIIGSGIRGSKLVVPAALLGKLPNAQVLDIRIQS